MTGPERKRAFSGGQLIFRKWRGDRELVETGQWSRSVGLVGWGCAEIVEVAPRPILKF